MHVGAKQLPEFSYVFVDLPDDLAEAALVGRKGVEMILDLLPALRTRDEAIGQISVARAIGHYGLGAECNRRLGCQKGCYCDGADQQRFHRRHYIPPKANRHQKSYFSRRLSCDRNAIDPMVGRFTEFRRFATPCDKLDRDFIAAVCLVATVCYWF